jgi:hypothetical protein
VPRAASFFKVFPSKTNILKVKRIILFYYSRNINNNIIIHLYCKLKHKRLIRIYNIVTVKNSQDTILIRLDIAKDLNNKRAACVGARTILSNELQLIR